MNVLIMIHHIVMIHSQTAKVKGNMRTQVGCLHALDVASLLQIGSQTEVDCHYAYFARQISKAVCGSASRHVRVCVALSQAIYWMGQVTDLWEGRKGFHATVEKEPSMYRLPELVAANIPLLGRCNLVVGLIEKTAASPPSPMTPPSYPSFPPIVRKPDSMDELTPVMIYLAVAVGVLSLFTIAYHRCYRRYRKAGAKVNEEVQNAFTAKLKADKKAPKDPPKQVPEGGSNPGDGAAGVSSMPP